MVVPGSPVPLMVGVLSLVRPFWLTGPVTPGASSTTPVMTGICAAVMSGASNGAVGPVFPAVSVASAVRASPLAFGGIRSTLKFP